MNSLKGTIPPELGQLSNIRSIDLSANNLTGTIPTGFQNLRRLEYLDLFGIPPLLGANASNLTMLALVTKPADGEHPSSPLQAPEG